MREGVHDATPAEWGIELGGVSEGVTGGVAGEAGGTHQRPGVAVVQGVLHAKESNKRYLLLL